MQREKAFRKGDLPLLFCSPTMELGVDIATLNAVGMRNVPPTPRELRAAVRARRAQRPPRSRHHLLLDWPCPRPVLLPPLRPDGGGQRGATAPRPD
ncbi:hypothetical protein [Actinomadura madurae]|uniref:hypothetical protein n=1 Tax=Actinomadura madurae TaxID=1993 RepID=UPI0035560282